MKYCFYQESTHTFYKDTNTDTSVI